MEHKLRLRTDPGVWICLALMVLLLPLPWLLAVCVSGLFHELCHWAAVRLTGSKVIELHLRTDGVSMTTTPMTPGQSVVCSLAGPVGAFSLLLLSRWMPRTALCAVLQSAYHLLPVYPLDGGRAMKCMTEYFGWHPQISTALEISTLGFIALTGLYLALERCLGLIPLCLSCAIIFRTCREKYLANRTGTGYNRCDNL